MPYQKISLIWILKLICGHHPQLHILQAIIGVLTNFWPESVFNNYNLCLLEVVCFLTPVNGSRDRKITL